MNSQIWLILVLIMRDLYQCISKKLILLPYNSTLCNTTLAGINNYFEFTVNQQLNFETSSNISSVLSNLQSLNITDGPIYPSWQLTNSGSHIYVCRALVKPMGRYLELHDEKGDYSFWNIRVRIIPVNPKDDCSDNLILQFRHKHNLNTIFDSHSAQTVNITCKDSQPIIIPSTIRKVYLTYFSSEYDSPGYHINVTSFIHFHEDISLQTRRELCRRQDGFWCGNETNICLFRDLKCDGSDSCFDGGSDEFDCPPLINYGNKTNGLSNKGKANFIDYLPWLALCILPLILLMALVCICNQHRGEVYFDDEEDNLDIDKSQDDIDVNIWSSLDAIDQMEKGNNDKETIQEEGENDNSMIPVIGKEPLIGLQTIYHPPTTKADITGASSGICLNKEYEDTDKAASSATVDSELVKSKSAHTIIGEENRPMYNKEELNLTTIPNAMTMSQITDEDYDLEDVGSLLRKVDKSKIPEELRMSAIKSSSETEQATNASQPDSALEYRSDYILV